MVAIPEDIRVAWVECKIKPTFAVSIDPYIHFQKNLAYGLRYRLSLLTHDTGVGQLRGALKMENDSHVILIIGRIEPRDIKQRPSQAISKILCIQGRLSIFGEIDRLALRVGGGDISDVGRHD